jgi:hypothetical protein
MTIIDFSSPRECREAFLESLMGLTFNAKNTYHFHGFAGQQIIGDPSFFDISGNKHDGLFGANLSNASAWANPGYVSTVNPAAGVTDSVIRMPNLNFNYNGGEKLILWWLGKVTPEAAGTYMMGDGGVTGSSPGVRIRINTNGTSQITVIDAVSSGFSGSSVVVADGNLHCMAWVLDGAARKFATWVDAAPAPFLNGGYSPFNPAMSFDTRNNNSFQIGSSSPKSAASTDGIATQTRAFVMLKLGPDDPIPTVAQLTTLFQSLRRDPGKIVLESAF